MEWCVYMLYCCDGTLYTGSTNRLEQRVLAHAQGRGAKYTRSRRPVELIYQETAADRSAALRREAQIKRWSRQEKWNLIKERNRQHGTDNAAAGPANPGETGLGNSGPM